MKFTLLGVDSSLITRNAIKASIYCAERFRKGWQCQCIYMQRKSATLNRPRINCHAAMKICLGTERGNDENPKKQMPVTKWFWSFKA